MTALREPDDTPPPASGDDGPEDDALEALSEALKPLQLLGRMGGGGMGDIYLARDPTLRRTLAVKVLHAHLAADSEAPRRFLQEARIIAGLNHPNIVSIHAVGALPDETPYYVMEYVEGGDLAGRIRSGRLPSVREARRLVASLASALSTAHGAGVVHLDVKPSNVLYDDETGEPKLSDWGIAALRKAGSDIDLPVYSGRLDAGSPGYMSPEQFEGVRVGPEADVYSLGVLAFELLTGRRPFQGSSAVAIMAAQLRTDAPRLSEHRPDVDAEFSDVVARALRRSPALRPSADEVQRRLDPHGRGTIEWPPPGLGRLLGTGVPVARRLAGWLLLTCVVATALMERGALVRGDIGWYLTAVAACLVSGVVSAWVGIRAVPIVGRIWRARRNGYDWLTVLDVLADSEGDTGFLIAGSRSYGRISTSARGRILLVRRFILLLYLSTAGIAAFLLSVTMLRGPIFEAIDLMLCGAGLAALAAACRSWEWLRSLTPKAEGDRRSVRSTDLMDAWYLSLERLKLLDARSRRQPSMIRTAGTSAVVLGSLALFSTIALPSLLVGFNGRFADAVLTEALLDLDTEMQDARRVSVWSRLSLTPRNTTDGGRALWAALAGVAANGPSRPSAGTGWTHPTEPRELLGPLGAVTHESVFQLAAHGFDQHSRQWIESVVDEPAMGDLARAAEGSSMRLYQAVWAPEAFLMATLRGEQRSMPEGWVTLRTAKVLEAALLLDRDEPARAETSLRELLSVVFMLARDDPFWGRAAVGEAAVVLAAIASLHEAAGEPNPIASGIRATLESLGESSLGRRLLDDPYMDVSAVAIDMLEAGHGYPAHRLAVARVGALASRCGSIVEVAQGANAPTVRALGIAERELATSPQVRHVWSTLIEREPPGAFIEYSLAHHQIRRSLTERLVPEWISAAAGVLGNRRIRGCRSVLPLAELYLRI